MSQESKLLKTVLSMVITNFGGCSAEKADLTPRIKKLILEVEDSSADIEDAEFGRMSHVRLHFGPDLVFSRAYSVVSGDMRLFELGVAKDDNSRGGYVYLHDQAQVGEVIKMAKGHDSNIAKGDCIDNSATQKHIFVIGGIGVTAFLAEIARLSQTSADYEATTPCAARRKPPTWIASQ
jgi:ferredoxin-NADP reductase